MNKTTARAIAFVDALYSLPWSQSLHAEIDQKIEETAKFLAAKLNPGLKLGTGSTSDDYQYIYVEWEGSTSHRERDFGCFWVARYPFKTRYQTTYRKNVSKKKIFELLDDLKTFVKLYRGDINPAERWSRLVAGTGYIVVSSEDSLRDRLPRHRKIILPADETIPQLLAFTRQKFRKPEKRIAVYEHLAKKAKASDAQHFLQLAQRVKPGLERSSLTKIGASLDISSQASTKRRL